MPFNLLNNLEGNPTTWSTFKTAVQSIFTSNSYSIVVHDHTFSITENPNISWTITVANTSQTNIQGPLTDPIYLKPGNTVSVEMTFTGTIMNMDNDKIQLTIVPSNTNFDCTLQSSSDTLSIDPVYPYEVQTHTLYFSFVCPSVDNVNNNVFQSTLHMNVQNLVGITTPQLSLFEYIIDSQPPTITSMYTEVQKKINGVFETQQTINIDEWFNGWSSHSETIEERLVFVFNVDEDMIFDQDFTNLVIQLVHESSVPLLLSQTNSDIVNVYSELSTPTASQTQLRLLLPKTASTISAMSTIQSAQVSVDFATLTDRAGNTSTISSSMCNLKTTVPKLTAYAIHNLQFQSSIFDINQVYISPGTTLNITLSFDCEVRINDIHFILPNGESSENPISQDYFSLPTINFTNQNNSAALLSGDLTGTLWEENSTLTIQSKEYEMKTLLQNEKLLYVVSQNNSMMHPNITLKLTGTLGELGSTIQWEDVIMTYVENGYIDSDVNTGTGNITVEHINTVDNTFVLSNLNIGFGDTYVYSEHSASKYYTTSATDETILMEDALLAKVLHSSYPSVSSYDIQLLNQNTLSSSATWHYTVQNNDEDIVFELTNIVDIAGNTNNEQVPPSIFETVEFSMNGVSPNRLYAKEGSVVTLFIETEVEINKPEVMIALQQVDENYISMVDSNPKKWSVQYTVPSPVNDVPPQGLAMLVIRTTETATNNMNIKKIAQNQLFIDTISAQLESLEISSNNTVSSSHASDNVTNSRAADTITLTINANEDINEPQGNWNFLHTPLPLQFQVHASDTSIWVAELNLGSIDPNEIVNGPVQFEITYTDIAGNQGTYNEGNISLNENDLTSNNIIVDTVPPQVTIFSRAKSEYNYSMEFSESLNTTISPTITFGAFPDIVVTPTVQDKALTWTRFSFSHTSNKYIESVTNIQDAIGNEFTIPTFISSPITIDALQTDTNGAQYFGSVSFSEDNTTYHVENTLEINGDITMGSTAAIEFSILKIKPPGTPIQMILYEPFSL